MGILPGNIMGISWFNPHEIPFFLGFSSVKSPCLMVVMAPSHHGWQRLPPSPPVSAAAGRLSVYNPRTATCWPVSGPGGQPESGHPMTGKNQLWLQEFYGDGSKPWYRAVNPKIAGKWMFIPLKMYL